MRFLRYGKTYQLEIKTPEDLRNVLTLDESLWVATSAPGAAFRCDPALAAYLDSDGSGRIHTDEVRAAVAWILDVLSDLSGLTHESDQIDLSIINSDSARGKALLDSSRFVLSTLGDGGLKRISLEQVRTFLRDRKKHPMNGDGIIVPAATPDKDTAIFIKDVIACLGGQEDASGEKGINDTSVEAFLTAVHGLLAWRRKAETSDASGKTAVLPLGSETYAAYKTYQAIREKVDHYFVLCNAMGFTPLEELKGALTRPALEGLLLQSAESVRACMESSPLASPSAGRELLVEGDTVNPHYRAGLSALAKDVLSPILKRDVHALSEDEWMRVKEALQPYIAYLNEKTGEAVEALPVEKLTTYSKGELAERIKKLIVQDKKVGAMVHGVREVERLLIYHRYLFRLLNNFVNFSELYSTEKGAMFESGCAVIDGRWFNLSVVVEDVEIHQSLAKTSNIFTMYLEITGIKDPVRFCVAVPATAGSKGNLFVGKRGIFFDVEGTEYDARIIKIIENPISLLEALAAPFVRLWQFVIGKIEALSGASEKELQKSTDKLLQAQAAPSPAASPAMSGGAGGMLVGLSLSAAAIGSSFAFMTKTLSGLSHYQQLMGIAGAAVLIGVPVALIATLKLKRQDLSSLLEGCGWAINARMRFNGVLRRQFTRKAPYPLTALGTPRSYWLKKSIVFALFLAIVVEVFSIVSHLIK